MKKLFLLLISAVSLSQAEGDRFPNLPQDSLLRSECELGHQAWLKFGVKIACANLNNMLGDIRERGYTWAESKNGRQMVIPTGDFDDMVTEWDRACGKIACFFPGEKEANANALGARLEHEVKQRRFIGEILADHTNDSKHEELHKLKKHERSLYKLNQSETLKKQQEKLEKQ